MKTLKISAPLISIIAITVLFADSNVKASSEESDYIPIQEYVKTRWILYPQYDTRDDSDHQLLCYSLHICMIDWFQQAFPIYQQKRMDWKMKLERRA